MVKPALVLSVGIACLASIAVGGSFTLPEGLTPIQQSRFDRFKDFQIKGVCNDDDLTRLASRGVNTVRGYSIPSVEVTRAKLDEAHALGIKVIVSEWMAHQGENKRADGNFNFDYDERGDEVVRKFIEKLEGIGDHPAILMWGLGNEVHLDEPYLRTVNRMSLAIHERFPHHITSLTMVNAKEPGIEAVKRFAPDLDVIGIQSYSRGAVRNAIRSADKIWGKPFYVSEFNTNGPWNVGKAPWGVALDEPVAKKVRDLQDCYKAIDESPLCLGSTIFVWGHAKVYRPTYFGLLLDPNPNGPDTKGGPMNHMLITPQADVMTEHFNGKPIDGNHAPILTRIEFAAGGSHRFAMPGEPMKVNLGATDADDDEVRYLSWVLDSTLRAPRTVAGPFIAAAADHAIVNAPQKPGEYLLMVYAIDGRGAGSASTLPFKVPTEQERSAVSPTTNPATRPTTMPAAH